MLSNEPAQTIAIRKIRHRDKDCVGIFIPWNPEITGQIKRLPDLVYSASLKGWIISYTITDHETQPDLLSLDKTEYPFFLQEQAITGTIADATAENDHTGISSPAEEHSVRASNHCKPEAADIPGRTKKPQLQGSEANLRAKMRITHE